MSSERRENAILPKFFDLLTEEDKIGFKNLKESLNSGRNKRGKRLEAFAEMLDNVKKYAVRDDEDDWKRCMVCGICWVDNGIAINTRQLRLLIDKCKSSINGSLHRMGYCPTTSAGEINTHLVEKLPILKGNFSELRQWTVRQQGVSTPQPKVNTKIKQAKTLPFMSPAANIPTSNEIFEQFPTSQSCDLVGDIEDSSIFQDPFCLPMNNWNEDIGNGDDSFYNYDEPYAFSPDI